MLVGACGKVFFCRFKNLMHLGGYTWAVPRRRQVRSRELHAPGINKRPVPEKLGKALGISALLVLNPWKV